MTTRRHPFKFYLPLIFGSVFLIGLSCAMGLMFFDLFQKGQIKLISYSIPLFSGLVLLMAFYTPWKYFENAPIISIDNRIIRFGDKNYNLSDIKEVALTGKMPFKYIITFPMEGVAIVFNSGHVEFIFNDMYSNTWELKSYLKKVVIDKGSTDKTPLPKTKYPLRNLEEFNGNHVLSFNGLMFYGWIIFVVVMIVLNPTTFLTSLGAQLSISLVTILYLAGFSYQMHYFALAGKFLSVRNSIWFWRKHDYEIENIQEVVFEMPHRLSTSMRIITTDFREKLYPAGNLNDKTWLKLKTELEKNGITVRNEAIF